MTISRRSTTQDVSWFLDLAKNNQLELNPPYQRRSVWSPKDRKFFLDTIFRHYPSPAVYLNKQIINGKHIYAVVDGKQRLETIIKFSNNEIAIDKNFGDIRLDGQKWNTILQDETLSRVFWDYVIPVEFISIEADSNLVNQVFDRLNRNSRKLVDQELRHAKYDGWFIKFVEKEAEDIDWERLQIVTTARAKRMKDVQFISELLIVILNNNVIGFDQEKINHFYADFEDLEELEINIDIDYVKTLFDDTKKYLLKLEEEYGIIGKFSKDFNNFYTLWAVVSLNFKNIPEIKIFSERYIAFMKQVEQYKDENYIARIDSQLEKPVSIESYEYYRNSLGASTDLPKREKRYSILKQKILG